MLTTVEPSHKDAVLAILELVLPQAAILLSDKDSEPPADEWMAKLRLAHPALYMRYFALALPKGQLSEAQFASLTDLAERDPFGFAEAANTLMPDGLTPYFADRFFTWVATLQLVAQYQVARATVKIWERFSPMPASDRLWPDRDRPGLLIYNVLAKTPDRQERVERAIRLVQDASLVSAVRVVEWSTSRNEKREPLLNEEEGEIVKKYVFERMDKLTDDELLAQRPFELLLAMSRWGRDEAARAWAERLAGRRESLVGLLADARQVNRHVRGRQVRDQTLIRRSDLAKLLDVSRTNERAAQFRQSGSATPDELEVLDLYMTGEDAKD
jgi:hypothetical protein